MGRKQAEQTIYDTMMKLDPTGKNKALYKEMFSNMSEKEFKTFIDGIPSEETKLAIVVPNGGDIVIDLEKNIKIAKDMGYNFHQNLVFTTEEGLEYSPDIKFFVGDVMSRRTSQTLNKGISVAKDNAQRNMLTGQVTGDSKGNKLTDPENNILVGLGLEHSVVELMKHRGGDLGSSMALNAYIERQGSASQKDIEMHSTGVVSTRTLKTFMNGAHLKINL